MPNLKNCLSPPGSEPPFVTNNGLVDTRESLCDPSPFLGWMRCFRLSKLVDAEGQTWISQSFYMSRGNHTNG